MKHNPSNTDALESPGGWTCPVPLRNYPRIVMGHGGGGKLSRDLIENMFLPAFQNDLLAQLSDSAVIPFDGERLAFSTDSFVVRPLFFPGGCIGDLAVNGTVNDLAMSGARPLCLSAGFIIEEGLPLEELSRIVDRMSRAAAQAGVPIVTGDTKVVEKGHGDGCYINTSGIGIVPRGINIAANCARPGDVIILSGTIADHGMAIMSVREGLEFEAEIHSDCAALHGLVQTMLNVTPEIRVLRDPTRGGVAAALNEISLASNVGMILEEIQIPIQPVVQSACEILGLDPLFVANEGKLLAIVPAAAADAILTAMRQHELGQQAQRIGEITENHPGLVVIKTGFGTTRVISMPLGDPLPRIC